MEQNILKTYFKLLHKYIPQPKKNNEFLEKIIYAITEKEFEKLIENNKTENVGANTISNWLGARPFPQWLAKAILGSYSEIGFENFISENISVGDSFENFIADFQKEFADYKINDNNYPQVLTQIFLDKLEIIANPTKYPKPIPPDFTGDDNLFTEQLKDLISKIVKLKEEDFTKPDKTIFNPKSVDEKLYDKPMLKTEVKAYATNYFNAVSEYMKMESQKNSVQVKFINSSARKQYEKLKAAGHDKSKIYSLMQNFFKERISKIYDDECYKVIVSYFIQICEVFDAPSK